LSNLSLLLKLHLLSPCRRLRPMCRNIFIAFITEYQLWSSSYRNID